MMIKKIMSKYFIIPFLFIGFMVSDVLAGGAPVENIRPENVWFTTRPPAARADIASATLLPFEGLNNGYLRPGRTAYFNIYADFDANEDGSTTTNDVKFYVLDKNGTQVECVIDGVTNGCITSIMKNSSSGFTLCVNGDLLSSGYYFDSAGTIFPTLDAVAPGPGGSSIRSWRFYAVACSDSDTCEGKVSKSLYQYSKFDGHCWHSWAHGLGHVDPFVPPQVGGNPIGDTGWNAGLPLKAPLYIRFTTLPIAGGGDLDEIEKDFTIGISITGTNVD